jgi:hypothetical protein
MSLARAGMAVSADVEISMRRGGRRAAGCCKFFVAGLWSAAPLSPLTRERMARRVQGVSADRGGWFWFEFFVPIW